MSLIDELTAIVDLKRWMEDGSAYAFIEKNKSLIAFYERRNGKTSFDIYHIKDVNISTPKVKAFVMIANGSWSECEIGKLNKYDENNETIELEFDNEDSAKEVKKICDSTNPNGDEDSATVKAVSKELAEELKINNPTPEQQILLNSIVLAQGDIGKPLEVTTELVTCLKRFQIASSIQDLAPPKAHSLDCVESSSRNTFALDDENHVSTGCLSLHNLTNTLTGGLLGTVYGGTINDAYSSDFKLQVGFNWEAIEKEKMGFVERCLLSLMIWYHILSHVTVAGQYPLLGLGQNGLLAGAILQSFNAITVGKVGAMVNCLNNAMSIIGMRPNLRVLENITTKKDVDAMVMGIEQQLNALPGMVNASLYNYTQKVLTCLSENKDDNMSMLNMISLHKKKTSNTLRINASKINDEGILLTYEHTGDEFKKESIQNLKPCTHDKTPTSNQSINH